MASREELLSQDCTPFPGPCHSVGVQLNKTKRQTLVGFQVYVFVCLRKRERECIIKTGFPVYELTEQGSRRSWSVTSGHEGLTFQEFPNSSAVDSTMPCRVVKSFSVSPSKLPHRPPTRPRRCAARRTYTRIPENKAE